MNAWVRRGVGGVSDGAERGDISIECVQSPAELSSANATNDVDHSLSVVAALAAATPVHDTHTPLHEHKEKMLKRLVCDG